MEILTSVVGKITEYTIVPIGRQASYLIFYKGNFKKLKDHVENLQAARERMLHSVERERRNGREIEKDVLNWLEKVNEVIENANRLQNDPRRPNVRCSAWSFPNLILRHQLSRKATKITNDVDQVQRKEVFYQIGYLPPLDVVASSSSTRDGEKYDTRELLKEDIVKALADPTSRNIGVYGLGGVGKTTLVLKVAETANEHKLFDKVVITEVSKNPDIKKIQGEIADFLSLRFEEESNRGRAERLRQRIKMEKSILIILDNIWTILDLKTVGIPFGNEHNGCKLLMSCRSQEVLSQMDVPKDFTFKVELMSLPLRVVTVARAMKNKRDVESWKDALRKLQSNDHTEMEPGTYSALELSYNSLESDEMRALFLLFALLLRENVEYFLKVAIGLDILKHVNAIDYARNRLYSIIKSLEARCLLLEVKTDRNIQMHDFVRDFAISIARRDKHVLLREQSDEEWPTKDFFKRCTQIALNRCDMHELPQTIDCPNIKLFYLISKNQSLKIPDTFFKGMRSLRALDLTCLKLLTLPTSFRLLTELQTLCLDFCILENMDAIEALQNLKILRLWNSSMIKLPREIEKLTQLRMLDLSHSGIEVVPPNIISSLSKLEELYMENTSINWEDVNSTVQNENASLAELQKLPKLIALELQIRETWMLPRDLQLVFEKLERYKIAIGDVWDWSDIEDGTLKTLMLKLGTNIHLEHGIKALIEDVENLYLDDVDGIQNVLPNLNREGFTLLKHLHVQNNTNLNHIVENKERNQIHASFPILETLVLLNLKNLEHIFHGQPSIASFGKLSVIKVKNCVQLKYIFSYPVVKELYHISKIKVCECNSMKEVVFGDNNSSAKNDIIDEKIEFLQLRFLTLEHLETLDNFASDYLTHLRSKEKYQGVEPYACTTPFFNAQVAFPNLDTLKLSSLLNLNKIWDVNHQSMCNLTSLIVDNCVGLKYLFPSTLVESFLNLKYLEISNCLIMEDIITKEDRNNAVKEVHFLKLEKIILKDMDSLKTIWHQQFETSKMLKVNNCKKIVVVFPSSMQNTYNELEKLEVRNCDLVEEIFELNLNENNSEEVMTQLKEVTLDGLLKLKKIWSEDPQGILSFQNLINVQVVGCSSLEYSLPFSIATRCSHLKELCIKSCWKMKEIVAEEKESSVNAAPVFEFNQLSTLLLWHSPKLNGFYAGNHTLLCPSLRKVDVYNCTKLNLFRTHSTRSSNFGDDKHSVLKQQPLFIAEEVIPNLEFLRMEQADADMLLQTKNSCALFCKMTYLGLAGYNTEDARFPYWFLENVHTLESLYVGGSQFKKIFQDKGEISEKTHLHIKSLTLNHLPKLQHICEEGSQIDPVLEFLECLNVENCSSLINLMPSSVTLNHLTKLEVIRCNGLKYLITTPTARSLDKLTVLKIKDCNSLEEVVNGVENVDIAFISLQILMLECLPSLVKFCSSECFMKFPLLEKVIVGECPRMKIFSAKDTSTPILRKVKIAQNDSEWHWKGNLNDTIYNMFEDKVGFGSFKHLKLTEYPELKELWYGQLEHNAFRSLKHLVVHKCDFLSNVLFQPNLVGVLMNLEKLDVKNCNSLEAVFDLKGEFTEEIAVQNSTQLKKLKLSNLPKLKHVWKEDPHYTMRFQNLSVVSVADCKSLISLFPLSVARDMMQLQSLLVSNCGIEEIVVKEEGPDEMVKFVFPHLTSIELDNLTKLKAFFVGVHSLQCKSLKTIKLFKCPRIELFKAEPLKLQESSKNVEQNISTYQPLFVFEEELLTSVESTPQFRELELLQLHKLKYICKEGFQMDPFLHFLESIDVCQCSSLIKLVPSSVTFSYMTYLEVTNCNGLINLITHSTAKSLVKLTTMKIEMCNWLEDIVNGKEDETNEIVFCSLQTLELISLQRLIRFCSCPCPIMFPLLEVVVVKECPRMELFSLGVTNTTNLQNVQTDEENHWEGDLNRTIKKMFFDKVAFGEFKYLALSDYPEIKDLWYGQLHHNMFCNLKHLVVERCDFLSHVLFPSNVMQVLQTLEELEVKDCDSLEAVFDVKGMKSQKIMIKQSTQLKRLTVSSLPKLKHIWNEDPHEIISFGNLCTVDVSMCQSLLYIFPYSLCLDLGHLEMLKIESCGVKEIVSMEETGSMDINFNFPQLKVMILYHLNNLKSFYQGKHTLDFPSLKTLNVYRCEALRMFSFNNSDLQQPYSVDENQDMLYQQPLFCIEKLSPNLEELALNGKDMLGILNGYCQENIFHKVKFLRLQCFNETPTILLNDFHTIFPNVETFQVRNSSFETLFPTKGARSYLSMQMSNQIRKMWLFELDKLKHIWQEDFPLDHHLLQYLEELHVVNCPSLISLVPSSTSFTNLTHLKVDNCEELIYLIKISTAKSLVQLKALNITNCEKMLDVVNIDDDKAEENIIFENLEYLEFTSLSNLRSFCYGKQTFIFPSLLRFIFKGCPQMKIFSSALTVAPCLTSIEVEEENMRWKGDLNTTIEQMFIEKIYYKVNTKTITTQHPKLGA
ncbi:disease resistance protein (CC-NBS-LRR class) family protein [Medicago truncatula]|uniref:Disease resistance protein (CC-NBS-LRR class) family protein n=1 Tax=Medicago truncatula TaxID=3880 RepID=A0A072TJ51_MEDTR|nr:disease resistance protein (CC-NBS-LRR class) family protein [Medicago truncatula]